jgi:phosphoserine phosphatase RsbU/P
MKVRVLIGLLAALLVVTTLVTFYNYASSPTDENLFTDSPGRLMFAAPLEFPADSAGIDEGDILVQIGGVHSKGKSAADMQKLLSESLKDSTVSLAVNQSKRLIYRTYRVPTRLLRNVPLEPIDSTLIVLGVTPGGASDRAGMLVGDIIERINGQKFGNAQEADRILRRAQSGGSFTYEVLRGRKRLTLNVVLAAFGIPLATLVFSLAGIAFIGIGAFIALKRPRLVAARLLGLGFMLIGFIIAVWLIRRDPDPTLFVTLRATGIALALFFGIATSWHAGMYFPLEREELISRRWITWGNYGLALILTLLSIILARMGLLDGPKGVAVLAFLVAPLVIYNFIVRFRFRKFRAPQYLAQREIIKRTSIAVGVLSAFAWVFLVQMGKGAQAGFIGLVLVLLPLSYLYTIGRYRLLDMNLRIRRNVQYMMVSIAWGVICLAAAVGVLVLFLSAEVHLPSISIHGTSIEVSTLGAADQPGGPTERFLFMALAVGTWLVLWKVLKGGQALIDKRYYRTRYDYRRALGELSEMLATKLSMNDLGRGIVEKLAHLMQVKRAGVFFFRDETVCCCREAYGVQTRTWEQFCAKDEQSLVKAIAQFEGEFSVDYLPEPLKTEFRALEFRYILPIRSKDQLIGAVVLGEKLSEATFSQEDLEFLSAAAKQASVSIENAFLYEELAEQERMKHELEIARRIQMASLPQRTPQVPGLEIAGQSVPAQEVGGDFFDYLNGTGEGVTIVVGDVSGKGTSAALYMSKVQGILRSLHGFTRSPAELFVRTNLLLRGDIEKSSFVTALGTLFNPVLRTVSIARAGHLPLYWYRPDGDTIERIATRGLGLGLDDGSVFAAELEEKTLSYHMGDVLLFVTDGITEARNAEGEEFGEERLVHALRCTKNLSASEIRSRLLDEVKDFAGSTPQHDDQTVVVVKGM